MRWARGGGLVDGVDLQSFYVDVKPLSLHPREQLDSRARHAIHGTIHAARRQTLVSQHNTKIASLLAPLMDRVHHSDSGAMGQHRVIWLTGVRKHKRSGVFWGQAQATQTACRSPQQVSQRSLLKLELAHLGGRVRPSRRRHGS